VGERLEVYTDGACAGNGLRPRAPGGWSAVFSDGRRLSGGEAATTNQRMELLAAIHALREVPEGASVTVYSDSAYLCNAFADDWFSGWIRRGWRNSRNEPVANRDLWEELLALARRRDVQWRKVRGHAGNRLNELADRLAVEAARRVAVADGQASG
jgi:ribonuclease HI